MRARAPYVSGWAVLAALVLGAPPAGAVGAGHCQRPGARTLRQTATTSIYIVRSRHEVYACWRANGRTVVMGSQEVSSTGRERVDVGGLESAPATGSAPSGVVAWKTSAIGGVFLFEQVISANLRTGLVIHRSDATPPPGYSGPEDATVESFTVTPSGSLGWVGRSAFTACEGVHDIGADGIQRDLECSPAAARASVSWASGILSWSDGATTKSVPLG